MSEEDSLESVVIPLVAPAPVPDFISMYINYSSHTETPVFFNRWTAISMIGTLLGRNAWFDNEINKIYPNLYCMLIGSPGTKKSSAIKQGVQILRDAGYSTVAAQMTRYEKFLLDLSEGVGTPQHTDAEDDILSQNLWEEEPTDPKALPPAECYIAADEFNVFIKGSTEFIQILGDLWDYNGLYRYRLKNSKSIYVPNPTISILGGTTQTGFAAAFPPEAVGLGFLSRLLLVYCEPSGKRVAFPRSENPELRELLVQYLREIKQTVKGEMTLLSGAKDVLVELHEGKENKWRDLSDGRFSHYSNRRFTHLLKLCIIAAASQCKTTIDENDVVYANTLLSFTEHFMPKALGAFGKSRNVALMNTILELIDKGSQSGNFEGIPSLTGKVLHDIDGKTTITDIASSLIMAGRIKGQGPDFISIKVSLPDDVAGFTEWSLLSNQEINMA